MAVKDVALIISWTIVSRVVDRAINEYLDGRDSFSINDVPTKKMAAVLYNRLQAANNWQHTSLSLALKDLVDSLDDDKFE